MKYRYHLAISIALFLYGVVGIGLFYLLGQHSFAPNEPREQTIHLPLAMFSKESKQAKRSEPPKENVDTTPPRQTTPPMTEQKPEPFAPEPALKPKPTVKQVTKRTVPPKKWPVKKKKTGIKKRTAHHPSQTLYRRGGGSAQKCLARIKRTINRHKQYPRAAQRRGIEGSVTARFTILANGQVGQISLSGPKVLHGASRQAIRSAFPIDTRTCPITLPRQLSITLHYQMR